ncbi:uncharacterized protein LOC143533803 [Bidens hawaiensis]|uniref:uncharacterized protein LOC143533803 n=1 Tax=Bidens hawaiensis TaxID=980011 RepID=UPI00404A33F9
MGHKHLHELLKEDQEPFHLKTFISDRRSHLKPPTGKTSLNLKKQKHIIKNVCFTFQDSPEFKNSPVLDFPCNNATGFHIPARTAALLLHAATRVQKPKTGSKQTGFGLLGSFLRRLKDRSVRTKRSETGPVNVTLSSTRSRKNNVDGGCDDGSRISSGEWSEKSSEMDTSCSSRSVHEFEEIECFCSNPSSPFRFSLQRSPSQTRRRHVSSPLVASPCHRTKQDKENYEVECPQENIRQKDGEKEQCSPVSVLDPLFDDGDEEEREGRAMEEGYDIECSYANVQRAKHQLLLKLQRFERLAELDPIKLEKHMLEQRYNEDEDVNEEEVTSETLFREILNYLGVRKLPWYMRKLVFDLIAEENKNEEQHEIVQRVCKRLHSWKMVELDTIDMMAEADFRGEGWKRCDEDTIRDMAMDIELAIFTLLAEELAQ